jgi:hypothetical protein
MIRTLSFLVTASLTLATAEAQPRPSTTLMTCAEATRLVSSRGAIVLGTGGQTYDRFVADRSFCEITEAVRRGLAPTRDAPQCLVGYRCYEPGIGDSFWKY